MAFNNGLLLPFPPPSAQITIKTQQAFFSSPKLNQTTFNICLFILIYYVTQKLPIVDKELRANIKR